MHPRNGALGRLLFLAVLTLEVCPPSEAQGLELNFGTGGLAAATTTTGSVPQAGAVTSKNPIYDLTFDFRGAYLGGTYGESFLSRGVCPYLNGRLDVSFGGTELLGSLSGAADGKYGAAQADIPGGSAGGFYALLDEGGIRQSLGPLSLELGRLKFSDEVTSPYSLFVNSLGISSDTMAMRYDDGTFFYYSRWLGLNHDSSAGSTTTISSDWPTGFPERGANLKTYGLKLGEYRFGIQDSTVYAGRWFDYEYFLSPLPMYFSQYVRGNGGTPWTTNYDDNEILGAFFEWNRPGVFYLYGQFLLDDLGVIGDLIKGWYENPWQLAASLGGRYELPLGSIGLYLAMATKYTFEPSNGTTSTDAYGYCYYPETRFSSYWSNLGADYTADISIEDNEIGYKYGENNLAIEADWRGSLGGFDLGAALEFRLAGSNSPANPGQNYSSVPSTGTEWLNDSVLEKRFLLSLGGAKRLGAFRIYGILTAGFALDAMDLVAPTSSYSGSGNGTYIYTPQAGNTQYLWAISLGATYSVGKK